LIIPPNVGWNAEALAEDGTIGGYVIVNGEDTQYIRAIVWDAAGNPSALPVLENSSQSATVLGFRSDGTPLGTARPPSTFPGLAGYWTAEGFTSLPDFGQGGAAFAGNAHMIVGSTSALEPGGEFYVGLPTIWDSRGLRRVTGLPGLTGACWSVNSSGTYVGVTIDRSTSATVYGGFVGRDGSATRLDYAGFPQTRAFDINDDGWFTGIWLGPGFARRAYLAREDQIRDLDLFPGYAESWAGAINNDGTIVGAAANFGLLARALVWFDGQPPVDLNTLVSDLPAGTVLTDAYDINNAGQILARANNGTYVLTPIPEPGTVALLATLLPALLARRERNCRVRH
jgi:probable HAF family extracellular repeat protein